MNIRLCCARILAALLALITAHVLRAVDPEPFTLPVSYSFKIANNGNAIMKIDDGTNDYIGYTYGTADESPVGMALMKPGKRYNLNFQFSAPYEYSMSIVAPGGYQFYMNGVPRDYLYVYTGGGERSDNYTVEIRPINGAGFLPAGSFTGIDIGQAVSWELGLGASRAGHSVGRVGFREKDLSSSPATREKLLYTPPINSTQVNIIYDGPSSSRIRQIVSPRVMVDFYDISGGYEIRYYNYDDTTWVPATPIYTINSGKTPWRTIKVESPGTNQLKITETFETATSASKISHLELTSGSVSSGNYVWTLLEGGPSNAWLRKTTHTSVSSGGVRQNTIGIHTMSGTTEGALVSEVKYVYHTYPWGEGLYQVVANPNTPSGTTSFTSTYAYHDTAPSSGDAYRGNYGRVKSVLGTDGSWVASEFYDDWERRGQLKYQYRPFQDSPSSVSLDPAYGRVQYFEYIADPTGRYRRPSLRQEKINNVTTAKTVWAYDNSSNSGLARIKAEADIYKDASNYHRTRTEIIDPLTADLDESGEPYLIKNPDGSQLSWSRAGGDYDFSTKAFTVPGVNGYFWRTLKIAGTSVAGTTNGAESSAQSSYNGQNFAPIYLVPNKSTMEVTILDYAGVPLRTETRVYTGSGNWSAAFATVDSLYDHTRTNRLTSQSASNGATTSFYYTNGYLSSRVDANGVETQFTPDSLGRTSTSKKIGVSASGDHATQVDITTAFVYDGADRVVTETVSAVGTSETVVTNRSYDRAGRLTSVTPPGLSATAVTYNPSGRTQTTTAPDGGTTIQETYRDGRLKSTTGTAVVPQYFSYSVETDGRQLTQVNSGTSSSTRLQKSWTDWIRRPVKVEKPGFSASSQAAYVEERFYDNTTGQFFKATRTGMKPTLYVYDALGRPFRSGLDVDNGGALVLDSDDRITDTNIYFEPISSNWWLVRESKTYPLTGSSTAVTTYKRSRLTGFPTDRLAEVQDIDLEGNVVSRTTDVNRTAKLLTLTTSGPCNCSVASETAYNGLPDTVTTRDNLLHKTQYDALGRKWKEIDPRNSNATTRTYHSGTGLLQEITDAASNPVMTIDYDNSGRTLWTRDADTKYTRFAYNLRGQLTHQWGNGAYPVSFSYDSTHGDRTGMSTYRSASADDSESWPSVGSPDTTTWTLDGPSGLLWKKTDAANGVVELDYDTNGRTSVRKWARTLTGSSIKVSATYGFDPDTGDLLTVTYNDNSETIPTPDITYTYTRAGQVKTIDEKASEGGVGVRTFNYDSSTPWRLANEALPAFFGSRQLTRLYDTSSGTGGSFGSHTVGTLTGRAAGYELGVSGNTDRDLRLSYTRSNQNRFVGVSSAANEGTAVNFVYAYESGSRLIDGYAVGSFSTSRDYEANRDLTTRLEATWGSASLTRFDYTYDDRYQRVTAKQSGSAYADYYHTGYTSVVNLYTYNARGELETAAMYRGDSTTPSSGDELPGRRFEYRYDSLGNRKTDGPTGSASSIDDQYTTNALNQYTAKENNTVRALGTAATTATVGVTGALSTGRKDRAWGADFLPANSGGAAKGSITAYAAIAGGGSGGGDYVRSESKPYLIAAVVETFTYDADGNLKSDGLWEYTYNAENQLVRQQCSLPGGFGFTRLRLDFKYDYKGRRIEKRVYNLDTSTETSRRFVYDGWNLIAELDGSGSAIQRSYTWGLDLTGDLDRSGGIGALLRITNYTSGTPGNSYLPTYDGNGNVVSLVNASTGALAAVYEYDPYGNPLRDEPIDSGVGGNPFRHATRYRDEETGLYYYGRRYYSPKLGRWICRDPKEEAGGLNLYGFVGNSPIHRWDYLGMTEKAVPLDPFIVWGRTGDGGDGRGDDWGGYGSGGGGGGGFGGNPSGSDNSGSVTEDPKKPDEPKEEPESPDCVGLRASRETLRAQLSSGRDALTRANGDYAAAINQEVTGSTLDKVGIAVDSLSANYDASSLGIDTALTFADSLDARHVRSLGKAVGGFSEGFSVVTAGVGFGFGLGAIADGEYMEGTSQIYGSSVGTGTVLIERMAADGIVSKSAGRLARVTGVSAFIAQFAIFAAQETYAAKSHVTALNNLQSTIEGLQTRITSQIDELESIYQDMTAKGCK